MHFNTNKEKGNSGLGMAIAYLKFYYVEILQRYELLIIIKI